MKIFFPKTGTDAEWNAACYRLEDYLRAWGVDNKAQQAQIILKVMYAVAPRHELDPTVSPTTIALEELWTQLEQWFTQVEPKADARLTAARVAMLLSDGEGWSRNLLAEEVPPAFVRSFRENRVIIGPDLQISSMVPRPLDSPTAAALLTDERKMGTVLVPLVVLLAAAAFALAALFH